MNNLFKCKPKVYAVQSSKEEVYQQESFYKIIVEDEAGAMKRQGNSEIVMDKLFEAMKNYRVEYALFKIFGNKRYNFQIEVSGLGRDRIVKVTITKRRLIEKISRCFKEATKNE